MAENKLASKPLGMESDQALALAAGNSTANWSRDEPDHQKGITVALEDLSVGRVALLRDDRTEEGAVLVGAEFATPAVINFMITEARGVVSLALSADRCEELRLEEIPPRGAISSLRDSVMVSIEAKDGVTTGISAADRARTIEVAIDPASGPSDLVSPGHIFPHRASRGGVLECPDTASAAVDLLTGAGLSGAAVLCGVMRDDGRMAHGQDLTAFAADHGMAVVSVTEVVEYCQSVGNQVVSELVETGRLMRTVMGHFATGVSVVSARGEGGAAVGTTANAISSVSLDPPLLLACLANSSETLAAILRTRRFAINILAAGQRDHSDRFAVKGHAAHAEEVGWHEHELSVPVLLGALATIVCDVDSVHQAGDHKIVLGRALHLEQQEAGAEPLIFFRGSYARLHIEEDASG